MTLQIVGSGLGRTGTMSLKLALEKLLGGRCYHMLEVGAEGHVDVWHEAANGNPPDWTEFFDGWSAVVDWPAAGFWRDIADAFPEALVLHSERSDTATWQRSAHATILDAESHAGRDEFLDMWDAVAGLTFDGHWSDPAVTGPGYERHNAEVRASVSPERLVLYQPGDGWAPLCAALELPVPDEPFPHVNTTEKFIESRERRAAKARDAARADEAEPDAADEAGGG